MILNNTVYSFHEIQLSLFIHAILLLKVLHLLI